MVWLDALIGKAHSRIRKQTDGSETLSLRLEGLPSGIVPTSDAGRITFLGMGNWNIDLAAVPTLRIPAAPNYSGENPYPSLKLVAAVQELDGDQAVSDPWVIDFEILPVADGFAAWDKGTSVTQGAIGGLPLDAALRFTYIDKDGSEEAVTVQFDLSSLIEDAGIGGRLAQLPGSGTGLVKLVNNYLNGPIQSFDPVSGIVTALARDVPSLTLDEDLFLFSNQDFVIPVSVLVRDTAVINGAQVFSDITEQTDIRYNFFGVAETPTVFANDAAGLSLSYIPVSLGGESTDDDVLLGREPSERIYFIISEVQAQGMPFNYAVSWPYACH